MELVTFKMSGLIQIICYKTVFITYNCYNTYVCLLDFWLFVYLFFVCL